MKITVDKTTREVPFSEIKAWCIHKGELFRKIPKCDLNQLKGSPPCPYEDTAESCCWNAWSTVSGLYRIEPDVMCQPVTVTEVVCEEIP